jgi:hypothetical protein
LGEKLLEAEMASWRVSVVLISTLATITGCASMNYGWHKPGVYQPEFAQDKFACMNGLQDDPGCMGCRHIERLPDGRHTLCIADSEWAESHTSLQETKARL